MTEDERFLALCRGDEKPDAAAFQAGHDAHAADVPFHECPYPFDWFVALSWRLGWNERALSIRRTQEMN
jgi:hypothetical protein